MASGQIDLFCEYTKESNSCDRKRIDEPEMCAALDELSELSAQAYSAIIHAQMDDSMNSRDISLYIKKVLDAAGSAQKHASAFFCKNNADAQLAVRAAADRAACDRGDPLVRTVLESAQRVGREIHRLMGLLRFSPGNDGIWLARCSPDNSILPVFSEYFTLRFGRDPWAIIDEKRGLALVRLAGKEPCLGPVSSFPFLSAAGRPEDGWELLWRSYHKSINIENRKNPALQLQLMPRRYWKYLPEIN